MKVLLVTNMYPDKRRPNWGTFVRRQVVQLEKLGHHVEVLVIRGYQSKLEYLTAALRTLGKTFTRSYDLVHAHYGLSGLSALLRWKIPLVVTLHGSDVLAGRIEPFISRWVARLAGATIVVSRQLQARVPGTVIPCGVDLELFRPHDRKQARARLGLPPDSHLILFPFDPVRRIKRFDLAEAAVEELRSRGHDAQLLVISSEVHETMPWYYSAADVMILCSESEGSPTSVKESLACNTPVVTTDVGDVREILAGSDHSRICASSPEALADGLEDVISGRQRPLKEPRSSVLEYDEKRLAEQLVQVYETVTNMRRRRLLPTIDAA